MKSTLIVSFLLAASSVSYGTTITWSNNLYPTATTTVDLGVTTKSFLDNSGAFNLFATSLDITNMPNNAGLGTVFTPVYTKTVDLGYKNEGPLVEYGLGIMTESDAEIRWGYALQLNLSSVPFSSASLTVDSLDAWTNEGFRLWGSTTAGGPMTLLAQSTYSTGGNPQTVTFGNTYSFFELTSDTPNCGTDSVLLRSVAVNTVPEPATLVMMGAGLLGVGWLRLRMRS
ncbi:MAG TPA: PEP-CTERM sorting domain-containing protein [Bryobacteraceae bacterium]|jgi:hypothetical protein